MTTQRVDKVSQAIKEEVAQILQKELKDPRIGFVTITRVQTTADLKHATIYFSFLESQGTQRQIEEGLKSAQGYIRRLLGERLRLRFVPEIRFERDTSIAENIRISKLLEDIGRQRQGKES